MSWPKNRNNKEKYLISIIHLDFIITALQVLTKITNRPFPDNTSIFTLYFNLVIENALLIILFYCLFTFIFKYIEKGKNITKKTFEFTAASSIFFLIGQEIINLLSKSYEISTTNFLQIESSNLPSLYIFFLGNPGTNGISWGLKIANLTLPLAIGLFFSKKGEKLTKGIVSFLISHSLIFLFLTLPTYLTFLYKLPKINRVNIYDMALHLSSSNSILGISKNSIFEYRNLVVTIPVYLLILGVVVFFFRKKLINKKRLFLTRRKINVLKGFICFAFGIFVGTQVYPRAVEINIEAIILGLAMLINIFLLPYLKIKTKFGISVFFFILASTWLIMPDLTWFLILYVFVKQIPRYISLNKHFRKLLQNIIRIFQYVIFLLIGFTLISGKIAFDLLPNEILLLVITSLSFFNLIPEVQRKKEYQISTKKRTLIIPSSFLVNLLATIGSTISCLVYPDLYLALSCLILALLSFALINKESSSNIFLEKGLFWIFTFEILTFSILAILGNISI